MNPNTTFPPPQRTVERPLALEPVEVPCDLCHGEGRLNDRGRMVRCALCEGSRKRPRL